MQLKIELTPDDLLDLQRDRFENALHSEEFLRREIFCKAAIQNEENLNEGGQFSQLFEEFSSDPDDPERDTELFEQG